MASNPSIGEPEPKDSGSLSIAEMLRYAAEEAIWDGNAECSRARGKRGSLHLSVEINLGDNGEPLWVNSSVYFIQKRHRKDKEN